jgi:hypothetical protein
VEIAVSTSLFAKRYMQVNAGHQLCIGQQSYNQCGRYVQKSLPRIQTGIVNNCKFVNVRMKHCIRPAFYLIIFCCLLLPMGLLAKVNTAVYGVSVSATDVTALSNAAIDSMYAHHPQLVQGKVLMAVMPLRVMNDKTTDFYILLGLCLILGVIRVIDPRYFSNLWRAFRNPAIGRNQLKDQMETASFTALLMNIFFTMMMGAYLYYAAGMFSAQRSKGLAPSLLIAMLMGSMMLVYLGKYLVIRFSGWAFKVESITEHYIFNVFLINKILGIILLPFTIFLAFAAPEYAGPAVIVSFIVIAFLLMNRYTRSWQHLGSFFQYSKFHFFTYLCASELLPLAVLAKLLLR